MRTENERKHTRDAENTFSRENPGKQYSREQQDTGTLGRIGRARKRHGNNRHS